jgi:hypothetical protein
LNTLTGWLNRDAARTFVPRGVVLRGWLEQLAARLDAALQIDGDGDAELTLRVRGEARSALVMLRDGTLHVAVPSNYHFPPGRLPPAVVQFLAGRNRELEFADWDAITNRRHSYFTLKTHGRMDAIGPGHLQAAVNKMLAEAYTLDRLLEEEGYVC